MAVVISDSSPLVHLSAINRFELLRELYPELSVPYSVWEEVTIAGAGRPGAMELAAAVQNGWIKLKSPHASFIERIELEGSLQNLRKVSIASKFREASWSAASPVDSSLLKGFIHVCHVVNMPTPIITVEQMRSWESASWGAGKSQRDVIENVGRIVAERALSLTAENDRILILAGKGHNGDDGRAAVEHLLDRKIKLVDVTDPKIALEEIARLLQRQPQLIIDALFGIGLNRKLSPGWIALIKALNARAGIILSVDVPSGLNAETGQPEGAAIEADITLTVGAVKRGLLAESAWPYVGRLEVAPEIGLIPCPISVDHSDLQWTCADDFEHFPPRRPVSGHKGSFGHLGIIAGSLGYHGAAVLAARGAQRAQPGLITLSTQPDCYAPVAAQLQSVMVHPWPPKIHLEDICSALLFGPGLAAVSDEVKKQAQSCWKNSPIPVVVDASALDWLQPGPVPRESLRIITPHPGEAARMLSCETKQIQNDRPAALRKLSERFGACWVALKGHQTLVGRAHGPISVNSSGNPFLAQGGSGDLLAGFIGGLFAQPALQKNPELTLRYAVWAHGAAADRLSDSFRGWTVEDLAVELR